jgi:tripartite-type tricarboxylate transporter receptor subunit TctC
VVACAALACHAQVPAQDYPVKPVRYLIAFSPGSGADTIGRIVAEGLTEAMRQQVVVENRSGAAGNIAAEFAARAAPDGYLVFQVSLTFAVNATLYRNLPYDLVRDFAPVTLLASSPNVLVVHPSLPVRSVADLVRLARARPGEIHFSSAGVGSATFLAAEMFKAAARVDMTHVPYRGGGEAIVAVMTGEVALQFGPIASWLPHVRAGRGRAIAVTSRERLAIEPGLPTVAESGYPDYESGNWYGLVVPAKTPKEIVARLNQYALQAIARPQTRKRLESLAYVLQGGSPEAFGAFIRSEIAQAAKILKETGVEAR